MKQKSILLVMVMMLVTLFSTQSCEDMLTVDTGDKSYTSANDTLYSYLGILKGLQNVAERQVILNEVRGDLISSTEYVTDTLYAISNFDDPQDGSCSMLKISDYYNIINNCNFYIANADTNKVKSNVKYMLPEYAQVQAIRGWTYLQLVNLYGEVPFISQPIKNLDIVEDFDYINDVVNKDNLIDKFIELGLDKFVDTNYPSYGNYRNGYTEIAASLMFIPVRLVLGDMYLLRGASESDYRKAAQYYYDYLKAVNSPVTSWHCNATRVQNEYIYSATGSWGRFGRTYSRQNPAEVVSIIASSANKQFGTMLTRVADIYGYTPSSSQSTNINTDADGNEDVSASGNISVSRNYKAQMVPSNGYEQLNKAQMYVFWNTNTNPSSRTYYEDCGDARYENSIESFTYEGKSYKLAAKASRGSTFYYSIPIYRNTLVWLRLAEAINRAGFPEHAFAILKDGLNYDNYPRQNQKRTIMVPVVDENGDPVIDEEGNPVMQEETETYTRYNPNGAMNYVDDDELSNFFLNFTDDMWRRNYGIHAKGCGYGSWTVLEGNSPITNITGNYDDMYFAWEPMLQSKGVDVSDSKEAIINAVEDIICDEMALELAFEGYRFSDLVRMANHKNASGFNGTDWLATKISARNARPESEDGTVKEIEPDMELYSKLQNQNLWYLTKPTWK